jgi:hypothetical protein
MACAVAVRDIAAAVNTVCGVGVLVIKKVGVTVGVWMVAKAVTVGIGDGVAVRVGIGDGVAVRVGTGDGEGAVDSFNSSAVSVARSALPTSVYLVYHRPGRNMPGPLDMTTMQTPNTTPKITASTASYRSIFQVSPQITKLTPTSASRADRPALCPFLHYGRISLEPPNGMILLVKLCQPSKGPRLKPSG